MSSKKKKLNKADEALSFSPRQIVSILAYVHWRNTHVIELDIPFSEIYSRMQAELVEEPNHFSIQFDENGLEMNLPSDSATLFQFDTVDPTNIEQMMFENPQIMNEFMIEEMGKEIFSTWKRRSKKVLGQEHKEANRFRKHLNEIWKEPLNLLEVLISTSREKGEEFYSTYHPDAPKEDAVILNVTRKLFARAILTCLEIHALLSHGFADGAEARYRTLYETMVISKFIMRSGYKTAIRFLMHEAVDSYLAIKEHKDKHEENGSVFISDEEFAAIEKRYNDVNAIFGKSFKQQYGWAISALPDHNGQLRFEHLEQFTEYNYLYPTYKDASGSIHSSSRSNYDSLAAPNYDRSVVIYGPSVFGIGEVTRNTAFVLLVFLDNILSVIQSSEHEAHSVAMYELLTELTESCAMAYTKLEQMASTQVEDANSDRDLLSFNLDDIK